MGDQEIWKLVVSQGIGFTLMFLALKWLLKDRETAWKAASDEGKARIALLEATSAGRSAELVALRSEFASYRQDTQRDISALHAKHTEQVVAIFAQHHTEMEGLQTEVRGLYKILLNARLCPVGDDFVPPTVIATGKL